MVDLDERSVAVGPVGHAGVFSLVARPISPGGTSRLVRFSSTLSQQRSRCSGLPGMRASSGGTSRALGELVRAARAEVAALGAVGQRGRQPGDRRQPLRSRLVDARDRSEQPPRVRVLGVVEDLLRPPAPLHVGAARVDHRVDKPRPERCRRSPGCRPRWPTGPRAATSPALPARVRRVPQGAAARGARTGQPDHRDRCWLTVEEKRDKREVLPGEIGLRPRRRRRVSVSPATAAEHGKAPLIDIEHLKVFFPIKQGIVFEREVARVHAVNDVTLTIAPGETLGLVGESGCGKTTLSRAIMRLIDSTEGAIRFRGEDITHAGRKEMQPLRREMQMVFQDPFASLNPRKRVGQIIGMGLRLHGSDRKDVEARVQRAARPRRAAPRAHQPLPARVLRRPAPAHRRRARARARARLIVLDEPVSALDVSVQAQIINLLDDLQDAVRAHLPVRRARPLGGPPRVRPDRGHVPRQADGGLARRGALHQADPPLHERAARRRSRSRIRARTAAASASSSPASRRTRSTRRRAASSIRAARARPRSAARWSRRWCATRTATWPPATTRSTSPTPRSAAPRGTPAAPPPQAI